MLACSTKTCVCVFVCAHACVCVCMCVCMCMCMCVYACMCGKGDPFNFLHFYKQRKENSSKVFCRQWSFLQYSKAGCIITSLHALRKITGVKLVDQNSSERLTKWAESKWEESKVIVGWGMSINFGKDEVGKWGCVGGWEKTPPCGRKEDGRRVSLRGQDWQKTEFWRVHLCIVKGVCSKSRSTRMWLWIEWGQATEWEVEKQQSHFQPKLHCTCITSSSLK